MERDAAGNRILRAVEEFPALGLSNLPSGLQLMRIQNGVYHLVLDRSGAIEYYHSADGMRSWQ